MTPVPPAMPVAVHDTGSARHVASPIPEQLARIAGQLAGHCPWREVVRFDAERRWYRRLVQEPGWEAWLLSWLPGQSTALHDHGPSSGAFTVLTGTLHETFWRSASAPGRYPFGRFRAKVPAIGEKWTTHPVTAGKSRAFDAGYLHDIANEGSEPAVSLHVYGPALTSMTRYTIGCEGLPVPIVTERAGADW